MCDDVLASNDIKVVGLPDTDVYARCVTADDAEAYASWLTARTRKRYRLPTAVEWEYAMRTIGAPVLSSGIVAEIVADCWQDLLPRSGREIIASQGGVFDCAARMLKGASTSDDATAVHSPDRRRCFARPRVSKAYCTEPRRSMNTGVHPNHPSSFTSWISLQAALASGPAPRAARSRRDPVRRGPRRRRLDGGGRRPSAALASHLAIQASAVSGVRPRPPWPPSRSGVDRRDIAAKSGTTAAS